MLQRNLVTVIYLIRILSTDQRHLYIVFSFLSYFICGPWTLTIVDALPKREIRRRRNHLNLNTFILMYIKTSGNELATINLDNIPINTTSVKYPHRAQCIYNYTYLRLPVAEYFNTVYMKSNRWPNTSISHSLKGKKIPSLSDLELWDWLPH